MDLAKAKSILILAFLFLNVFLGYRLWFSPQILHQGSILTRSEIAVAENLLIKHGFELTTTIPKQIPQLALLHVVRPHLQPSFWVNTFLPGEKASMQRDRDSRVYLSGNKTLVVYDDGHIVFTDKNPGTGAEASRSLAESFLKEWNLWSSTMKLDWVIPAPDGVRYRFVQTFQGFPLYFSTIEIFLKDGMAAAVRAELATPVGFSERSVTVISALSALELFVEEAAEMPNKRITDISLGYFSGNYDANRLETTPVWRIAVADGTAIYINAFSGEREEAN